MRKWTFWGEKILVQRINFWFHLKFLGVQPVTLVHMDRDDRYVRLLRMGSNII